MDTETFRIGELARMTGTKVPTIRYYESTGLMPEAIRTGGNQRVYGKAQLDRLNFIRRCRELGFSIEQIRELADLSSDRQRPCEEVDTLTRAHLAEIEHKLADLAALADELRAISQQCDSGGVISGCGILDALGRDTSGGPAR